MVVDSSTMLLLSIVEGMSWMTYRDHLLLGKILVAAMLMEERGPMISWISSDPLSAEVERLVSKGRLSLLFRYKVTNLSTWGSVRALTTSRILSLLMSSGIDPSVSIMSC